MALAAAVALVLLSCGFDADRANIVFVMTDDQPKNTVLAMPNVRSRIAGEGMTFSNAYVTESLCCPSRASILRGQYPHNTGVERNYAPDGGAQTFRENGKEAATVATELRRGGYATALVGKYLNGYDASYKPPGWNYWYAKADPGVPGLKVRKNSTVRNYAGRHGSWGDRLRDKALGFLKRRAGKDKPFALFLWSAQPHLEAGDYAERYSGLYRNAKLPPKPSYDEDVSDKPEWIRSRPPLTGADRNQLNEWHQNQLRSTRQVDDAVGDVLDLLRSKGELSNTYVIFTSDNGTQMGEHRWFSHHGAKSTPYEEAANVPLYVKGPGVPHDAKSNELILNNDFAPTFEAIAGLSPPAYTDGRSVLPAWKGGTLSRTAFLNERPTTDDSPMPPYRAALSKSRTYVHWGTRERNLYVRPQDPYENENAYNPANPPALADRLDALAGCAGDSCRAAEDGPNRTGGVK